MGANRIRHCRRRAAPITAVIDDRTPILTRWDF